MEVIHARNVNDAWPHAIHLVADAGMSQETRAGSALVVPHPVATVYAKPTERVLFDPVRDANPIFHHFEALWMLDGRDDANWLDRFVSDFSSRFAEEGGRMHGAYGRQWRGWFGHPKHTGAEDSVAPAMFDQLDEAVRLLREDSQSRQVVIQMWDPSADLGVPGLKDRPCLAGDTIVWSPEGDLPISEIAAKFASGERTRWPVYAVTEDTKELRLTWATAFWSSGVKKTYKITFDDGSSIRATADHVFYLRGRSAAKAVPVEVRALSVGDRILATRRWYRQKKNRKGLQHETIKKRLGDGTKFSNRQHTHIEYAKLLGIYVEGCDVHHKNENKHDNREVNLESLDHGTHSSIHKIGDKNPRRHMTPEQARLWGENHSRILREKYAAMTPEERKRRADISFKRGVDNHVIVKIEEWGEEEVFDFTVPDIHTALVGTGVVTHNCNQQILLRCDRTDEFPSVNPTLVEGRRRYLDMTVTCRSNDAVFGAYGANAVHFSILQEYLATRIGVSVGTYTQFSNNLHMYDWSMNKVDYPSARESDRILYRDGYPGVRPLVDDPEAFDDELRVFLYDPHRAPFDEYKNSHFERVAYPMWRVNEARLQKKWYLAAEWAQGIDAPDWRRATLEWIERRRVRKMKDTRE